MRGLLAERSPGLAKGRAVAPLCLLVASAFSPGCQPEKRNAAPASTARNPAPVPLRFSDVTAASGIRWKHECGASGRLYYPELLGGGGGLVDVDGDGWLDVVLVNSGSLPGFRGDPGRHALYLNNRDGRFRNATSGSGLSGPGYGMGVAAGDYDADGRPDLYVTGVGGGRLFHNLGGGRFRDVTTSSTSNRGHWGASASWTDVNGDGRLDLFIANYVQWSPEKEVACERRGLRTYCGPDSYLPDRCTLLLNEGNGAFKDASASSGLDGATGKALGVVSGDLEGDGRPDFFVACDLVPNLLFHNLGDGRFEEVAVERGFATGERGLPRAGMGIDAREEAPGRWSVWVGNLQDEGTALFRQQEGGWFEDEAGSLGLLPSTLDVLTFGVSAQDFDNDGRLDLALANGHIDMLADRTRDQKVKQSTLLLQRGQDGRFTDVTATVGSPFTGQYLARGLAAGDIDNDGDTDLLLIENRGSAHLWRNDTPRTHHWIGLDCRLGEAPAIGARAEITLDGRPLIRWIRSDGSFLSANDPRATFGIGAQVVADVRVRWPGGKEETFPGLSADRYWRLAPGRKPVSLPSEGG